MVDAADVGQNSRIDSVQHRCINHINERGRDYMILGIIYLISTSECWYAHWQNTRNSCVRMKYHLQDEAGSREPAASGAHTLQKRDEADITEAWPSRKEGISPGYIELAPYVRMYF